jgi:hypothetical protein
MPQVNLVTLRVFRVIARSASGEAIPGEKTREIAMRLFRFAHNDGLSYQMISYLCTPGREYLIITKLDKENGQKVRQYN